MRGPSCLEGSERAFMSVLRAVDHINVVSKIIVGLLVFFMVAIVAGQVFFRYILNWSLRWADEAVRYLMIWMAFIGASLAVKYGVHVSIETFVNFLSPRLKRTVKIAAYAILILFLASLAYVSLELILRIWRQRAATIPISMGYVYIAAPTGFFLMTLNLDRKSVV